MTSKIKTYAECCPEFDPKLWDDKIFEWQNKKFIKDSVFTLFYMPLNFGSVMKRLDKVVSKAEAKVPDWLCLSEHTSKWNMDIYLAVDKEIPDSTNTTLSGKFYCKVFDGSFKDTGKWMAEFDKIAKSKGYIIKKQFMWYTTCPKCAKKYGHNYVAILADIS